LFMTNRLYLIHVFGALIFILPFLQEPEKKKYTQPSTIPFDEDSLQSYMVDYVDTLSGETLHQVKTKEGMPLYYFSNIKTGVCFDNKCRPLDIIVYWNITGRYLGFELPDEEFLSKYDHEPFTTAEYNRLNTLLADSLLPLGDVSFEELIQQSATNDNHVDGVSGATSKEVLDFVVEGAAYTTHKLWNIIYGSSQDLVISLTEKELTPGFIALILNSPDLSDKIWALHRIDASIEIEAKLENSLMEIIGSDDFFLAYTAINAIQPAHLKSDTLQISLFSKYEDVNHGLKKLIVEKLKEAPKISTEVIKMSWKVLDHINGQQLGTILELYDKHSIHDIETCRWVASLLADDNSFISQKAYNYLSGLDIKDDTIIEALNKYR